jgi:hypothetical protein
LATLIGRGRGREREREDEKRREEKRREEKGKKEEIWPLSSLMHVQRDRVVTSNCISGLHHKNVRT